MGVDYLCKKIENVMCLFIVICFGDLWIISSGIEMLFLMIIWVVFF